MEHLGVIEIKKILANVTSDNQVVHDCIASLTIVSRKVFDAHSKVSFSHLLWNKQSKHALLNVLLLIFCKFRVGVF